MVSVLAFEAEQPEFLPSRQIFGTDEVAVDVGSIVHFVGRNLYLGIGAGHEVHVFAGGKRHDEFLYEGSHIAVGYHFTFPLLHVEGGGGNFDVHVGLYFGLACQAPVIFELLAREVDCFGGKCVAASVYYLQAALSTTALAAACRRKEDVVVGHCAQERFAGSGGDLAVAVDGNGHWAALHQIALGHKKNGYEKEGNDEKQDHARQQRELSG